jgi:hypothetical protein
MTANRSQTPDKSHGARPARGGSVRLKRPMRPLCGSVRLKRPKGLKGPMMNVGERLWGCAHRFRPTYALANVGHPSDFLRLRL